MSGSLVGTILFFIFQKWKQTEILRLKSHSSIALTFTGPKIEQKQIRYSINNLQLKPIIEKDIHNPLQSKGQQTRAELQIRIEKRMHAKGRMDLIETIANIQRLAGSVNRRTKLTRFKIGNSGIVRKLTKILDCRYQ